MEPADIIGKQIIGFKFEGGPGWNPSMHRCIGKVGTILKGMHAYCYVIFEDTSSWSYPYPEILDHLVEEEEEQTDDVRVSTVFLGLDHAYGGSKPILWETMIFGGVNDQSYQERYASYEQAIKGHQKAINFIKTGYNGNTE